MVFSGWLDTETEPWRICTMDFKLSSCGANWNEWMTDYVARECIVVLFLICQGDKIDKCFPRAAPIEFHASRRVFQFILCGVLLRIKIHTRENGWHKFNSNGTWLLSQCIRYRKVHLELIALPKELAQGLQGRPKDQAHPLALVNLI